MGNSLTLWNFKAGSSKFKTEVCSKTADPHLTMNWIKEVEIAKSTDELMTPIVERNDFPNYDMLDAMIASALKKLLRTQTHLPKKSKRRRAACSEV